MLDVLATLGSPGVAVMVALENLFPPVPSEVVLPLAGYLAGAGRLSLTAVLLAATLGSTVGAMLLYWAGRVLGPDRLDRIAVRLPLVEPRDIARANGWFARHGAGAVLLGRLIPGVRSFVSIPAGVQRMPLPTFVAFTVLGSAAYNTLLIGLGYALGNRWETVSRYGDLINYGIYAATALLVAVFVARRLRRRRTSSR